MRRNSTFGMVNHSSFVMPSSFAGPAMGFVDSADDAPEVSKVSRHNFDSKREKDRRRQNNRENARDRDWY